MADLARFKPAVPLLVAGITVAGLLLRLPWYGDALHGDELSTYFIAHADSLRSVVDLVRSDQEVTPPLYFIVAWATEGLGDPERSLRLAVLVAGTAAIPLTFLLGALTVGRRPAVVGAALVALSPLLILQSTEARAHGLMLALVLGSTIALVKAVGAGGGSGRVARTSWWIAYAVFSCAAIWTHYTAVFVLVAQLAWAFLTRPKARPALVAANVFVALGYLPWLLSGFSEDRDSPGNLLNILHPFSVDSAVSDLGQWGLGQSAMSLAAVPGRAAIALIGIGGAAALLSLGMVLRSRGLEALRRVPDGTWLVVALALASPVAAVAYSAFVESLLTPRNLIASWPGLALTIGAVVSAASRPVRIGATTLVLAGFAIGAVRMLDADHRRTDYDSVASFIERVGEPGSPVVEVPYSVNPLSSLEVALNDPGQSIEQNRTVLRVGSPTRRRQEQAREAGIPPVVPLRTLPTEKLVRQAAKLARGDTLFVVIPSLALVNYGGPDSVLDAVPSRFRHVETRTFPGFISATVYVFRDRGGAGGAT